ncbi:MAG: hypothetical protein KDE59_12140 [Anaerolineales bacterium]|nr:hypothetical protein [Anaerolineales bacterium]
MSDLLLTLGSTSLGIGVFLALGMILLLLAPEKKAHRLLATWVILIAFSYVIQQIGLRLDNSSDNALTLLRLSQLFGVIVLVESAFSAYGVVYFLNLENERPARWLLAITTVWSLANLALLTIFFEADVWLQAGTSTTGQFYPFDFIGYTYSDIPIIRITMYSTLALLTLINWINVYLFWRYEVPVTARIGSFMYVLATLTAVIPGLTPYLPFLTMAGGILITHAVLTSNLFDPLRSANEYLAQALDNEQQIALQLEKTLTEIEAEVNERSLDLRKALVREKQLSLELEQSLQQESELNELKTQIISNVSHEFRTPLTIIKSSSDMLNRYRARLDEGQKERYKQEIHVQIHYLDELLQDLLFINRSNASGIVLQPGEYDGRSLYRQLCSHWERAFAGDAWLSFSLEGDLEQHVQTDINLLQKIGYNLISNAIKFSNSDPKISVRFCFADQLILSFSDNGIGIVPGEEGAIFAIFQRGSNVQSRRGLGLGLYTVEQMVHVLGGRISAQNQPSGGSLFRISLPYHLTHELRQAEAA